MSVAELPDKIKEDLRNLGFEYEALKENIVIINQHLTILSDRIDIPSSASQTFIDQIPLIIAIQNPQDQERAFIDYIYATYVRVDLKTQKEQDLVSMTCKHENNKLPSRNELQGQLKQIVNSRDLKNKMDPLSQPSSPSLKDVTKNIRNKR